MTAEAQDVLASDMLIPKAQSTTSLGATWKLNQGLSPQFTGSGIGVEALTKNVLTEFAISSGTPFVVKLSSGADSLGSEGYTLEIQNTGIVLEAHTNQGLFYGIHTLRQMLAYAKATASDLATQKIVDRPALQYRGLMLDLARNFMPLSYLKSTVDRMALLKLNHLHLHLSDDQGWRIEIKKWPKLHQIGSQSATRGAYGYLTQEEYKELVAYGIARNVTIVPELDMPGHVHAIRAAYPQMTCHTMNTWPYTGEEVGFSKLCMEPTNTEVREFVKDILTELAAITPGPWIHMGGDEVGDPNYKNFVNFLDSTIIALGKTAIGWEEVGTGSTTPQRLIQNWKTTAAKDINSSCKNLYFDHPEALGQPGLTWCTSVVGDQQVYSSNPGKKGIEAALWGERVADTLTSIEKLYPRIVALSEAAWTPLASRNFTNYSMRLSLLGETWFKKPSTSGMVITNAQPLIFGMGPQLRLDQGQIQISGSWQQFTLYNLRGQSLWQVSSTTSDLSLPSSIVPGTYIGRISGPNGNFNAQVLIP